MKIAYDKMLPLEWFTRLNEHEMNAPRSEAEVLLTTFYGKVTRDTLNQMPKLRLITQFGVGYDNIDVAACKERGILVTNTPLPVIESTAELCMGLIYALARRISELDRGLRDGSCEPFGLMNNLSHTVYGKTLGIVGMGNIGRAVARRAAAGGMTIMYHNRHRLPEDVEKQYNAQYVSRDYLLQNADFVSLNLPLTEEVKHLIAERELHMMKSTAYLINTARGAHIDEAALVEALKNNVIAGAAVDVFEHEPAISEGLKHLNNCIIVPHVGTATWETRQEMANAMIDNIIAYIHNDYAHMTIVKELRDSLNA